MDFVDVYFEKRKLEKKQKILNYAAAIALVIVFIGTLLLLIETDEQNDTVPPPVKPPKPNDTIPTGISIHNITSYWPGSRKDCGQRDLLDPPESESEPSLLESAESVSRAGSGFGTERGEYPWVVFIT